MVAKNELIKSHDKEKMTLKKLFASYGFLFILAFMIIISSILSPAFLTQRNLLNVLRQMSITTIIGFGMTLIIISGMIDLSAGSVAALAGCIGTSMYVATGSVWLGLVVGLLVGAATGVVSGTLISHFGLPPFIATLAMMTGARGLVLLYTGGKPIINIGNFTILGQGTLLGLPIPILIMFITFALIYVVSKKTRLGRYVYAIGGNQNAAVASGVNVKLIKITTFIIHGTLTGLAGVILMSRINSGQPSSGLQYEMDAITAVVVGGTSLSGGVGTLMGTLIGGLIVGILNNILNLTNISPYWQQILKGVVIVLAVIMDIQTKGKDTN
ncbi:MAG: ABC transporter permease [Sphaerochaetaceae bacterium]